ncbi:MAG: hypothetical protein ABI679_04740 [Gemmatimonadota bacterium]
MKRSRLLSSLILASVLMAGLSCSTDQSLTAPPTAPTAGPELSGGFLGTGIGAGLLYCSPLPYASASKAIGAAGGTINVGPHSLYIPPGALSQTVTITAIAPRDSVNSVQFAPEGLTFARGRPATLTLSYANCSLLGRLLPKRIAYTTDLLRILSLLPSLDNILFKKVSAPVEHFSRYAVAW